MHRGVAPRTRVRHHRASAIQVKTMHEHEQHRSVRQKRSASAMTVGSSVKDSLSFSDYDVVIAGVFWHLMWNRFACGG